LPLEKLRGGGTSRLKAAKPLRIARINDGAVYAIALDIVQGRPLTPVTWIRLPLGSPQNQGILIPVRVP
jgi:hypothetical protein